MFSVTCLSGADPMFVLDVDDPKGRNSISRR